MSNGPIIALETVLAAAQGARREALSAFEAELMARATIIEKPKTPVRATDEVFAGLRLFRLYQGFCADKVSDQGAVQRAIEDLNQKREYFESFHKPRGYPILTSELDQPLSDPDHNGLATPIASRPLKVPLPVSKIPDVEAKFKSLEPGLTRKQQYAAVCNSFAGYHVTDRILRKAAKVVPVPRGRPRKQKQT